MSHVFVILCDSQTRLVEESEFKYGETKIYYNNIHKQKVDKKMHINFILFYTPILDISLEFSLILKFISKPSKLV